MTEQPDGPDHFVSAYGFQDLLGFRKTAFREGYVRFELDLGPQHMNRARVPHGGVHGSLLDAALGAAGVYDGSPNDFRPAVTLNLNISYLAVPKGRMLIAEGRRVGGGKTIYFSEGHVEDDTGLVLARATGTFRLLDRTRRP